MSEQRRAELRRKLLVGFTFALVILFALAAFLYLVTGDLAASEVGAFGVFFGMVAVLIAAFAVDQAHIDSEEIAGLLRDIRERLHGQGG